MKAILIIEDMPDKPGSIAINVMRVMTEAEVSADTGKYDTLASKYLLVLEGDLGALVRDGRNLAAGIKAQQAQASKREPEKCLH